MTTHVRYLQNVRPKWGGETRQRRPKAHKNVGYLLEHRYILAKAAAIPGHCTIQRSTPGKSLRIQINGASLTDLSRKREMDSLPSGQGSECGQIQTHTHAHSAVNSELQKSNLGLAQGPKGMQLQLQSRGPALSHHLLGRQLPGRAITCAST